MEELIALLLEIIRRTGGTLTTSERLRNNPDVCHAACLWFINAVPREGLRATVACLDRLDKNSLKATQAQVMNAARSLNQLAHSIRDSGKVMTQGEVAAFDQMIEYWRQPDVYVENVTNFVDQTVVPEMRTMVDCMLISMRPRDRDSSGHAICLMRNVGALVIYDPNIGIISLPLNRPGDWAGILKLILKWYRDNMGLVQFGCRRK